MQLTRLDLSAKVGCLFRFGHPSARKAIDVCELSAVLREGRLGLQNLVLAQTRDQAGDRLLVAANSRCNLGLGARVSLVATHEGEDLHLRSGQSDGTVRGRKKALRTLVTRMEQALDTEHFGKERTVAVIHGDCLEDARGVAEQVRALGFEHIVINDVSPSIGTHAGPGVVGLVFYGKKVD